MNATVTERFERARRVADAVLYEGYVLYPYRASAAKNQIRWQFGVVAPKAFCDVDPGESSSMQTEVLLEGIDATVDVKLRFLRVQTRAVQDAAGAPLASVEVDGTLWTSWDEAVEEEIDVPGVGLGERVVPFDLPAWREVQALGAAGDIVRQRLGVSGEVRISSQRLDGPYPLVKFRVTVENLTPWGGDGASRDEVVRRSLVALHTLLAVERGRFVSMIDHPEFVKGAVASCQNVRTWPVMIGEEGQTDVMLSSPITLYDYPEIAPESEGDMFDACEIDEILALRVLTLTDEEKREARGTDARVAAILDRVDGMPPEMFDKLHGAVRYLRTIGGAGAPVDRDGRGPKDPGARPDNIEKPWWDPGADASVNPWEDTTWAGTATIGRGDRVRLQPTGRADAHDMFLVGKTAVVEGVFFDVDGETQVAVVLENDDEAAEMARWHGRYLYFRPDEVEPLNVLGTS